MDSRYPSDPTPLEHKSKLHEKHLRFITAVFPSLEKSFHVVWYIIVCKQTDKLRTSVWLNIWWEKYFWKRTVLRFYKLLNCSWQFILKHSRSTSVFKINKYPATAFTIPLSNCYRKTARNIEFTPTFYKGNLSMYYT